MRSRLLWFAVFLVWVPGLADQYHKAPKAISDILDAPATPALSLSPLGDRFVLSQSVRYPSIADLSQPMLRLAGSRINPLTNGPQSPPRIFAYTVSFMDGRSKKIPVPPNGLLGFPIWSPRGVEFVFTNTTSKGIELWVANTNKGSARKIPNLYLNAAYGGAVRWMPQGDRVLVRAIPAKRGSPPKPSIVPVGPNTQDAGGVAAPVRTFQDLLTDDDDAALWEYYATCQMTVVNLDFGEAKDEKEELESDEHDRPQRLLEPIGKEGIFASVAPSPNGAFYLTERVVHPYSFLLPASGFGRKTEVWDKTGKLIRTIAEKPNAEGVPLDGELTGPRSVEWKPTSAATLVWVEALDGGDPKKKVESRDKLMMLDLLGGTPKEALKLQFRYAGITWLERGSLALITESDRDKLRTRTWLCDLSGANDSRVLWERSSRDRYSDPGSVVMRTRIDGVTVGLMYQKYIYTRGPGASPQGDRPFLDRWDLTTLKSERVFQSSGTGYETVFSILAEDASKLMTSYESPTEPPNFFIREGTNRRQLTNFKDDLGAMAGVTKQLVKYKRVDGVDLSFTLYLPAGHKEGERLPTVIWAYPLEFTDVATASQVSGSDQRYSAVSGLSPLMLVTQGYAVLMDATMPIIGNPETVNDTFIDQLVSSAKAAIDKAVDMGVTDRNRVAVMGHSYGAFMTANLLAHCNLFKAGVARSGAYNRTLTPFGFQSERRTIWQAPQMYLNVSPFMYADKIKAPILLIHGEMDDNPGTFPIQSERLFQAIKGNGGTTRLVMLPFEAHGYSARESIEHVQYETVAWLDKYVKNARN